MAEKKQPRNATPRKTTRTAKPQNPNETDIRSASQTVSTGEPTTATARNAVIEGNATINVDDVRRRAYEIYEERGGQDGLHEDDWYRAEQEIRARLENDPIARKKKSA